MLQSVGWEFYYYQLHSWLSRFCGLERLKRCENSVHLAGLAFYSAIIIATKLMREDHYSNRQAVMERGRDENLEKGARPILFY